MYEAHTFNLFGGVVNRAASQQKTLFLPVQSQAMRMARL
jgi:hypothetical protein